MRQNLTTKGARRLQSGHRSDSMTMLAEYGGPQFHVAVWNDPRFSGGKSDSEIIAEAAECLKVLADSKRFKGTTMIKESV